MPLYLDFFEKPLIGGTFYSIRKDLDEVYRIASRSSNQKEVWHAFSINPPGKTIEITKETARNLIQVSKKEIIDHLNGKKGSIDSVIEYVENFKIEHVNPPTKFEFLERDFNTKLNTPILDPTKAHEIRRPFGVNPWIKDSGYVSPYKKY